jgi:hypothetical protein
MSLTGTTWAWDNSHAEELMRKEKLRKERKAKIEDIFDLKRVNKYKES